MTDTGNFYRWNNDMSVGSEELDNQHRRLIEILNEVHRAFVRNEQEETARVLDVLSQYMVYHFTMEEVYFEMCDYCGREEHIREHRMFRDKVEEFIRKYKSKDAMLTLEILNFLKSWIEDHLIGSDQKYKECFAKHGVK